MIKLLSITNLAVISHVQVEFGPGLNILSGETGAGKSIILAALGLLLGERSSPEMLRTGESKAVVEGIFEVEGNEPLYQLLESAGIELDGADLIIRREIVITGRGKVFVNNQAATLNLLKVIQPHIIDVHGQGEQQSLLLTSAQTNMLDAFAGTGAVRDQVEDLFEEVKGLARQLDDIRKTESERLQMLDLLEYQMKDIEGVSPALNEDSELESERRILVNTEKLISLSDEVVQLLYDDSSSVMSKLSLVGRRVEALAEIAPQFKVQGEQLESAKYLLEDIAFSFRDFANNISYSPDRLEVITSRLNAIERLKRKYGGDLAMVIDHLNNLKVKYCELRDNSEYESSLIESLVQVLDQYKAISAKLSELRKIAARQLEKKLKKDLSDVSLEKAQFKIHFNRLPLNGDMSQALQQLSSKISDITLNVLDKEVVEFHFTANKGEESRLLSTVASGGELSRLMLILKTNISPTCYPRTLVFDEIDAGIGGKVADAVGVRLKCLAASNQVVCVTHQAQIARYADVHLRVAKVEKGHRTITTVASLDPAQRVEELSRMIAGLDITPITREHAKELLRQAG